jgi:peptidyl-prolyl cis-trans isomerase SurA
MTASRFRRPTVAALIMACALALPVVPMSVPAQAAGVEYTINRQPLTSYDIDRRAAFLRLQHRKGGRAEAAKEMIDQTLRMQEAARLKISIADKQVDDAYANFAKSNKLTTKQLDQVLAQAGVTRQHFREFIRAQMTWGQAMQARFQNRGRMSEQEAVQRMLKDGGRKPSANEYLLQQMIFVIPEKERTKLMGKRMREAEAMRARINSCEGTSDLAKQVLDVTVRNLGRVLEPELPGDWKDLILATKPGHATKPRQTARGVELITVCSVRQVNDDRVAQMVFQREGKSEEQMATELEKKYMEEIRKRSQIVKP